MIQNKTFLGIILARGGSKRVPRKNILLWGGQPLIGWTIDAGLKSKYLDKLIVSSDDNEILSYSKKNGADIQTRPRRFSMDETSSYESIEYVLKTINHEYDFVVLLQPTSPFRNEKHIDESIELVVLKNADGAISVCRFEHDRSTINQLPKDNDMSDFYKKYDKNSNYFRINGALYICNVKTLLKERTFFLKKNIFAYEMEQKESIDIDTHLDFHVANLLANAK